MGIEFPIGRSKRIGKDTPVIRWHTIITLST